MLSPADGWNTYEHTLLLYGADRQAREWLRVW